MWKVIIVLITGIALLTACSGDSEPKYADVCRNCGGTTSLHDVWLSVRCLMADPDTPIHDLTNDPRIASITLCGSPSSFSDCTHIPAELISINPDTDIIPLTAYLYEGDAFKYCYCVHPDGEVECFLEDGTNIRDL